MVTAGLDFLARHSRQNAKTSGFEHRGSAQGDTATCGTGLRSPRRGDPGSGRASLSVSGHPIAAYRRSRHGSTQDGSPVSGATCTGSQPRPRHSRVAARRTGSFRQVLSCGRDRAGVDGRTSASSQEQAVSGCKQAFLHLSSLALVGRPMVKATRVCSCTGVGERHFAGDAGAPLLVQAIGDRGC